MRQPTSWADRGLLEDDPFASTFYARSLDGGRRDRWCRQLAQDIKNDPALLVVAELWMTLAFAPEGDAVACITSSESSGIASIPSLEIFVRFYWELYRKDERAALKVINTERKHRRFGYLYLLSDLSRGMSGEAEQPNGAKGTPRAGAPRSSSSHREHLEALRAPTHVPSPPAAVAPCETLDVVDEGALATHPQDSNAIEAIEACPEADIYTRTLDAPDQVLFPTAEESIEENKDVLVFEEDHVQAVMMGAFTTGPELSPARDQVDPLSITIHDVVSSAQCETSDTAVDETASVVDPPQVHSLRKKAQPPLPPRERHSRAAANTKRLSMIAKAENSYKHNAKRIFRDDDDFGAYIATQQKRIANAASTSQQKTANSRKKSRTSGHQSTAPRRRELVPRVDVAHAQGHIVPTSSQQSLVDVYNSISAADKGQPSNDASQERTRAKAQVSGGRKKLKAPDASERPSKKQRRLDDTSDAIGALNSAMLRQKKSQAGHPTGLDSVVTAVDEPSASANPRKRVLSHSTGARSEASRQAAATGAARKIAQLPRRRSTRTRLADMAPRAPIAAAPGTTIGLSEADQVIRQGAAEASLVLQTRVAVIEEWPDDSGAQDAPLVSDDEEDIPLSRSLLPNRNVDVACVHSGQPPSYKEDVPLNIAVPSDLPSVDPSLFSPSFVNGAPTNRASTSVTSERPVIASSHPQAAVVPNPVVHPSRPPPPPFIPKQALTTPPPIWAESRQEVCESFDWFRSYQGGVYFNSDMVKGYLLSAFSSKRDVFARGGRFIISHGGGRAESIHNKKGQTALQEAEDQREEDKSVRALLRTYQMKRPLVLLIDDRYALFPYDLATKGYTYVVLGFYHIVHAWAEREFVSNDRRSVVRWKFAFEWCEKQRQPWWLQQEYSNGPSTVGPERGHTTITYVCPSCAKASPLVYEAWMCLHPNCAAFWTFTDGRRPPDGLRYDKSFLESSHSCNHDVLEDLAPVPPATQALDGVVTSRRFCKGWHCKQCGRLSCRFKWEHWECQNCHATVQIAGKTRVAKEFWGQTNPDFMHHKMAEDSGIIIPPLQRYPIGNGSGYYHVYILPENRGRIYLIFGSPMINHVADEIFGEYQEQAGSGQLRFRRWPLRSHQCRGTLLTNYFSQNTGEPYQYVGGTANTVPFDTAPSAIVKARNLIQERMNSVIQAEQTQYTFNEVLSAAYMEKQKMAFHSDAERGLGPRVASLSLGSSAYMHFRLLKKYRTDKGSGASQNAMTLFLRHGDVLIMDGAGIQEYYEHTVVPLNFRIAATARYIGAP